MNDKKTTSIPADINYTGRILRARVCKQYDEIDLVFCASGGFGCDPDAMGSAVFGEFIADGDNNRCERCMFDDFATKEQIDAAIQRRAEKGLPPLEIEVIPDDETGFYRWKGHLSPVSLY